MEIILLIMILIRYKNDKMKNQLEYNSQI